MPRSAIVVGPFEGPFGDDGGFESTTANVARAAVSAIMGTPVTFDGARNERVPGLVADRHRPIEGEICRVDERR